MKKPNNYWTLEKCQEVALKYNSRSEFRNNDASAYRTAISHGWLNEICSHMKYINKYWNYEKCKEEALKYTSRSEFQKKSKGGVYAHASKNKFLDDICSHMIKTGNKFKRCIYVFEFDDNFAYVGLTYNIEQRKIDHNRKGPVYNHIKETKCKYVFKQLTEYIKADEAQRKEEETMLEYENNGWKLLNHKRDSTLGGSTIYWTYDKCKEEALKYKHRTEFLDKSRGAAMSSMKNGWYEEVCSHMTNNRPKKYEKYQTTF
jgi:predicted GIY-YIG superfamily endonuclease